MRAMILAAGRGKRMGRLTDNNPKPLIKVKNQYLIEYSLISLAKANIKEIVINVSYHAEKIQATIGDGNRYGVNIIYSVERDALETGGGIVNALPLLGEDPFLVLSADIISDFSLQTLPKKLESLAHLVLVDNPDFKPQGDFGLKKNLVTYETNTKFTFANIGVFHPRLFQNSTADYFPLINLLKPAIENKHVTGEHFTGAWHNVGSPQELQFLNSTL